LKFNQLWVVEYSVEQNAFSVKDINEMLETNRANLLKRLSVDYLPIAFTPSRDAAIALSNDLRDNLDQQRDRQAKYESDNADDEKILTRLLESSEDKLWSLFRKLDPRPVEG